MNPTCPAGTSEDSFVVDFSSAFESPVSSLESKLTPTINGLLRAVMQERAINIALVLRGREEGRKGGREEGW